MVPTKEVIKFFKVNIYIYKIQLTYHNWNLYLIIYKIVPGARGYMPLPNHTVILEVQLTISPL